MKQNSVMHPATEAGVKALLYNCADLNKNDRVYIISNPSTAQLGDYLFQYSQLEGVNVEHQVIEEFAMHGQEPAQDVSDKMFNATIVFCLTRMSMAHTRARLAANDNGVKYFSLPDYSEDVMKSEALQANFKKIKNLSIKIAELLTNGETVRVKTALGTDLSLSIKGRVANPAPGFCYEKVLLASPPDGETNIAPVEEMTNGIAVIDGSIPCREIGLLDAPVTLTIKNGTVTTIEGKWANKLTQVFDRLNNPKTRIIGEFGIGLNPLARLKGSMLEDEGVLGTIHLGIGSNVTIGGLNAVPFHLDHIIQHVSVWIDDKQIMENGVFVKALNELI